MTQTDKEKLKQALDLIDDLIKGYESHHKMFVISDQPDKVDVTKQTIDDLEKIKKILMTDKEKADKVKLEAIKKILIELEEASGIVPGTKQITGWKSLFASTRWNKLSNNVQLERIENYIDGTVLEHNKKITKILEG